MSGVVPPLLARRRATERATGSSGSSRRRLVLALPVVLCAVASCTQQSAVDGSAGESPSVSTAAAPLTGAPPAEPTTVATDPGAGAISAGEEVEVVVTNAGWSDDDEQLLISGFVPGIVEDGGVCRAVLTGPERASVETDAVPDAGTTQCGALSFDGGEVRSGSYTLVLSYSSDAHVGNSEQTQVEIP